MIRPIKREISSEQRLWSEFTPENRMCRLKVVGKRCLRVRRKMLGFAEAIWQGGAIISNLHQVVRGHMCLVIRLY